MDSGAALVALSAALFAVQTALIKRVDVPPLLMLQLLLP